MIAAKIRQIIESDVGNDWDRKNAHGCDLRQCLVEPRSIECKIDPDSTECVTVWLVLEELPDTQDGYKIVYCEGDNTFGLVTRLTDGTDWFLGNYGSFIEAYNSM